MRTAAPRDIDSDVGPLAARRRRRYLREHRPLFGTGGGHRCRRLLRRSLAAAAPESKRRGVPGTTFAHSRRAGAAAACLFETARGVARGLQNFGRSTLNERVWTLPSCHARGRKVLEEAMFVSTPDPELGERGRSSATNPESGDGSRRSPCKTESNAGWSYSRLSRIVSVGAGPEGLLTR